MLGRFFNRDFFCVYLKCSPILIVAVFLVPIRYSNLQLFTLLRRVFPSSRKFSILHSHGIFHAARRLKHFYSLSCSALLRSHTCDIHTYMPLQLTKFAHILVWALQHTYMYITSLHYSKRIYRIQNKRRYSER